MPAILVDAQIAPEWANVRELRTRVERALSAESETLRDATCMVVSELLENAIKYGVPLPDTQGIEFVLQIDGSALEVRVISGAADGEHLQRLVQRIRNITESGNSGSLYLHRYDEILNDPNQSGGLGIYRIYSEGGFALTLKNENNVLSVVARRRLK